MKYIHYGHDKFDKNLFKEIKNREVFVKPSGGLWASNNNYEISWEKWCINEGFKTDSLKLFFEFKLSENSKILIIDSADKLYKLPKIKMNNSPILGSYNVYLDFEKLKKDYDAIEVLISKDFDRLYWDLYGWDCDCILIMNKDIIIPLGD
jgi:hypothetical protein